MKHEKVYSENRSWCLGTGNDGGVECDSCSGICR